MPSSPVILAQHVPERVQSYSDSSARFGTASLGHVILRLSFGSRIRWHAACNSTLTHNARRSSALTSIIYERVRAEAAGWMHEQAACDSGPVLAAILQSCSTLQSCSSRAGTWRDAVWEPSFWQGGCQPASVHLTPTHPILLSLRTLPGMSLVRPNASLLGFPSTGGWGGGGGKTRDR